MSSPGEEEDDAAIIGGSVRDPERFAAIFDRHAAHIQRYLARRLGGEIADDLVGETFLIAFGKRDRYDSKYTDARPWLYGIATNLVGQRRREEVREYRLRSAVVPQPDEACHAERVAAQVTAQAMNELLAAALAELSQGDRDVLLLIAWEGFSYDEVAAALDVPIGTVRSRLNRARKKVRHVLGQSNPILSEEVSNHG
jgi:RNA polymerase sigma-70 factor (ECF subfamily)